METITVKILAGRGPRNPPARPATLTRTTLARSSDLSPAGPLGCSAHQDVARTLVSELLRDHAPPARPTFTASVIQCFNPDPRFDRVETTVRRNGNGSSRFLAQACFYRGPDLVGTICNQGRLDREAREAG